LRFFIIHKSGPPKGIVIFFSPPTISARGKAVGSEGNQGRFSLTTLAFRAWLATPFHSLLQAGKIQHGNRISYRRCPVISDNDNWRSNWKAWKQQSYYPLSKRGKFYSRTNLKSANRRT